MPDNTITFQLATHYLSKTALYLDSLYETIMQACEETHPVIHHCALKNIIEIIRFIEKPELKSRFLKELIRIEHMINKTTGYTSCPNISSELACDLKIQTKTLSQIAGLFGEGIQYDPFLQSIKQTLPALHQDEEYMSPQLLFWLQSPPNQRQQDLKTWINKLHLLHVTVNLYLSLIKAGAVFESVKTMHGFYQRLLPSNTICHLILITIDKKFNIVPRMQHGHRNLTIRICDAKTLREIQTPDIHAQLGICHF